MFKGLALRFIIYILSSVTLIFLAVYSYNYKFTRKIIKKNIETNAQNLTIAIVNRIESVLRGVERVPLNFAILLQDLQYVKDKSILFRCLKSIVKNNPDISGIIIAFEPNIFKKNSNKFAVCFYKKGKQIKFASIKYEYFYHDWYQMPKILKRPIWSEPYYSVGAGNMLMATYSVPFYERYGSKKRFAGIVAVNISLEWLQKIVSSIKIGKTGYGFLISKDGTFVTHPNTKLIMNETIFTVAEEKHNKKLRLIGRRMIKGYSGFDTVKSIVTGKDCWLFYKPLPSSGWSLGVLFPKEELLSDIIKLNKMVLIWGILGITLIFIVIIFISESITKPLRLLSKAVGEIAKGNLDISLPIIKSKDEVGKLANSFRYMQESLKMYIKNLTETVAAKERIESELKIARDIQLGILPKKDCSFLDKKEIDLYAFLEPAKEVGGDFYDFFFVDNDNLCFVIGDVSGKGVPAAIFMSLIKTLVKAKATQGLSPDRVLTRANDDIILNNPSFMFVTLFIGILNVKTGKVVYSNAGHPPPYILKSSGLCNPIPMTGDIVLGIMEDVVYSSKSLSLDKGDMIFLYTDGVTEAMNMKRELFSEIRLKQELENIKVFRPHKVIENIIMCVRKFADDFPQSDDITMLCIAYKNSVK